jgi:sulfite reductase (NADPH) flavoprotein alpha-component
MFKWFIHQVHWLLGITIGLVLPVVGVTGAIMAFEDNIMEALSAGIVDVAPQALPVLTPDQLLARFLAQQPGAVPTLLIVTPKPGASARVTYRLPQQQERQADEAGRSYLDPYTGRMLGKANGEAFFAGVRQLHRFLLLGDEKQGAGKHLTAAAAVCLLLFVISGLYLRWPRRALDWKAWLKPDLQRRGRSLYWSLHAVAGTWFCVAYLIAPLTGLAWAYDWYLRGATTVLTGQAPPAEPPAAPAAAKAAVKAAAKAGPAPPPALDIAWQALQARHGAGLSSVLISIPKPGKPVRLRYLDRNSPNDVAYSQMLVDPASGAVLKSARYEDQPLGQRIVTAKLALHRGAFFGLPGAILFMLAAAALPLFPVTGVLLYLDRRRKRRQARRMAAATLAGAPHQGAGAGAILVAYASQSGSAEQLAWRSATALIAGGRPARVASLAALTPAQLADAGTLLVVAATYGAGEAPDLVRGFVRQAMAAPAALRGLRYAVLALGDRSYPDFCGFGLALDAWLAASGAQRLFPCLTADREQETALAAWRTQLATLGAAAGADDGPWQGAYGQWRLAERRLLNPGSPGGEAWHVALEALDPGALSWRAGDIAEIVPRQPTEAPPADGGALPPRAYSIASLPEQGRLTLLVRKTVLPDGRLGLGSGWLTHHAPLGAIVELRIRSNAGFHPPEPRRPAILIGAGTGLAGLLAHLRHRAAQDGAAAPAWLLFGERCEQSDRWHHDDIEAWRADGTLSRASLVFSRQCGAGAAPGERPRYVQDLLRQHGDTVRRWVADDDASILVCGGVSMAHGVDAALREILGQAALEALTEQGRYRRDVY